MGQELVNYRHRGLSWGCLLECAGAGTSGRMEKAYGVLHDGYGSSIINIGFHLIQHRLMCSAWFYNPLRGEADSDSVPAIRPTSQQSCIQDKAMQLEELSMVLTALDCD